MQLSAADVTTLDFHYEMLRQIKRRDAELIWLEHDEINLRGRLFLKGLSS